MQAMCVCVCGVHVKRRTHRRFLCFLRFASVRIVVPMDFSQMHKVFASSEDPREACDRNPNPAVARGGSLAELEVNVKGHAMLCPLLSEKMGHVFRSDII